MSATSVGLVAAATIRSWHVYDDLTDTEEVEIEVD
jgi:hypothetical protein